MVALGARGGLWGAIVPILLVGLSFAVVPAHALPRTFATSDYIKVDGPSEAVKNLAIELCVEDADRNEIIGRCVWDGESYAPGYEVHRYNKVKPDCEELQRDLKGQVQGSLCRRRVGVDTCR
jgi:hypothetical protein